MTPKITVAIPVFNGERYLSRTLDSLCSQRFREFEALCIDDCSTDNSLSIIKRAQELDPRIRLISTGSNLGNVPRVLNYALRFVRGAYFAYSSQDDTFSDDWLGCMYERALETAADAVIPDVVLPRGRGESASLIGAKGNRDAVLSGTEAVRLSLNWTIAGFALWKADLIRRIRYQEFGMNADEYSTREFFYHCNKVVFSRGTFFYRQDNADAISKKLSYKLCDIPYTHFMLYKFLVEKGFDSEVTDEELMRAVSSLIWMKQRLAMSGGGLSPVDRREAKRRLKKCYSCLNEPEVRRVVRSQRGIRNVAKMLLITNGYPLFASGCVGAASVRTIAERIRRAFQTVSE